MATLASIRTYAKANMGLAQGAATAEEALIDEWANDAVLDFLVRTHCHVNCLDLAVTSAEYKYDLPTEILAIKEVFRDSDGEPLIPVTPEEIIDFRRSTVASGEDTTRTRYAVLGMNMLVLWPTPTTAYTLDIWYVPRPTAMSTGTDDPSTAALGKIPSEFHRALEFYVLAKAAEYTNDKPSGQGQSYWAQYEQFIHRTALPAQNRMGGRLPRARVGVRPQRNQSANDVYPRSY